MNITALAAEIAIRIPAMNQDCAVNNARLIQTLIEEEFAKHDCSLVTRTLQKQVERLLDERDILRQQLDECRAEHIKLRLQIPE